MAFSRSEATFREGSKPVLHFQLYRRAGKRLRKLSLGELSTLTLTYFTHASGTAINSRTDQSIKNANNVKVTDDGEVIWSLQAADTAVEDTDLDDGKEERHDAVFEWVTSDGIGGNCRRSIYITRDSKV